MKLFSLLLCSLFITGCVHRPSLYQWGSYDAMLYQSYKNPDKSLALRTGLETHIAQMEQSKQTVAPGLYAELGTLYLQAGDATKAVAMYAKERDAWPESRGLMDVLIKNSSKSINNTSGVKS
jgi:hypothetical protein